MDEIERLYDIDVAEKEIRSWRPIWAEWFRSPSGTSGQTDNFLELSQRGNMSLIRAARNSTTDARTIQQSASWAIMKNFAADSDAHRRGISSARAVGGFSCGDQRYDQYEQESAQTQRQASREDWERLGRREQKIIISRFRVGLFPAVNRCFPPPVNKKKKRGRRGRGSDQGTDSALYFAARCFVGFFSIAPVLV